MMSEIKYLYRFVIIFTALFLFQGCSDSATDALEDDEPKIGSFSMSVDGDVEREVEGEAIFGGAQSPDTEEEAFVLVMSTGDPEEGSDNDIDEMANAIWLATHASSRPSEGTYSIHDAESEEEEDINDFFGFSIVDNNFFVTKSGQVEITSSSDNNVSGSFTIEAKGFSYSNPENELEVTIEGSFEAFGGEAFLPTDPF